MNTGMCSSTLGLRLGPKGPWAWGPKVLVPWAQGLVLWAQGPMRLAHRKVVHVTAGSEPLNRNRKTVQGRRVVGEAVLSKGPCPPGALKKGPWDPKLSPNWAQNLALAQAKLGPKSGPGPGPKNLALAQALAQKIWPWPRPREDDGT